MSAKIERTSQYRVLELATQCGLDPEQKQILDRCLIATTKLWTGFADEQLVCMWGLIPPTLLSSQAYLWLHTTEAVHDYEFLFVRNSQRAVAEMLQEFPLIVGHCVAGADRSIRWVKWLGAKLGKPEGKLIPFVIEAKNG